MRFIFIFLIITCPSIAPAQTYSTSSQGANYNGSSYVAPIVTKTYNFNSSGYQPPQRTSFNNYKYDPAVPSPFGTGSGKSYTSGESVSTRPLVKDKVYMDNDGKIGIKDGNGNILVPAFYDDAGPFFNEIEEFGPFWVKKDGKFGIISPYEKKPLIPVIYDEIKKINLITALVKLDGKVGVIGLTLKNSKIVIPIKYDEIGALKYGALWVRNGAKYGSVNTVNETILPVKYQEINDFSATANLVKLDNKMGLMSNQGKVILPVEYESISAVSNNVAWTLKDSKWGLVNYKGEVLASAIYDTVYEQAGGKLWLNDLAVVGKQGKLVYITKEGKEAVFSAETSNAAAAPSKSYIVEENFEAPEAKYRWKTDDYYKITAGAYKVTAHHTGDRNSLIQLPSTFAYSASDDWVFEMSVKTVLTTLMSATGIYFGNDAKYYTADKGVTIQKKPDIAYVDIGTKIKGVKDGKRPGININKDFNKIKLIRKGNLVEVYFNDRHVQTDMLKSVESGRFFLYITEPAYEGDQPDVICFDDFKFEILKK